MAQAMDVDKDVSSVLADIRDAGDADIAPLLYEMEDLWERKLWHQLTEKLDEWYADPRSQKFHLRLFSDFVRTFESKINQLALVRFALAASKECKSTDEAAKFITAIRDKVSALESQEAYVFAVIELARIHLALEKGDDTRQMLDEASKKLDALPSVEPLVQAAFYDVSAEYHKARAEYTEYYRNALLYLALIKLDDLTLVQRQARAFDLSVAALLGEKTYNFGELLLHPILDVLAGTEWAWLVDFLRALNAGDVRRFELLAAEHLHKQPILQNSLPFLKQKICLAALIEAVFQRPTSSRTLTFATIAAETHLPEGEVEIMVMKALSLGLLKGFIDQVSATVTVTWVQPRVMNMDQIRSMQDRLVKWDSEVKNLGDWIRDAGGEIWTGA